MSTSSIMSNSSGRCGCHILTLPLMNDYFSGCLPVRSADRQTHKRSDRVLLLCARADLNGAFLDPKQGATVLRKTDLGWEQSWTYLKHFGITTFDISPPCTRIKWRNVSQLPLKVHFILSCTSFRWSEMLWHMFLSEQKNIFYSLSPQ